MLNNNLLINFTSNTFSGNISLKRSDFIVKSENIIFKGLKSNFLNSSNNCIDKVNFSGDYISRSSISDYVEKFRKNLCQEAKKGNLTKHDVTKVIQELDLDLSARADDMYNCPIEQDSVAKCVTDYMNGSANSVLYIDFSLDIKRIIQNTVHEFTHLMQDNGIDETAKAQQASRYGGVEHLSKLFRQFELAILDYNYFNGITLNTESINKKLKHSSLVNPLDEFSFLKENDIEKYDQLLNKMLAEYKGKNKKFLYDFIRLQLLDEAQAYKEGFKTKKLLVGYPINMLNYQDLLPKIYEDLAVYFERKSLEAN